MLCHLFPHWGEDSLIAPKPSKVSHDPVVPAGQGTLGIPSIYYSFFSCLLYSFLMFANDNDFRYYTAQNHLLCEMGGFKISKYCEYYI